MKITHLFVLFSLVALGGIACNTNYRPNPDASANQPTPPPSGASKEDRYKKFEAAPVIEALTKLPSAVRLAPTGYVFKGKAVQYSQTIDREDKDKKEKPRWVVETLIKLQDMVPPEKIDDVSTVVLRKCEEVSAGTYGEIIGYQVVGGDIKGFGWKCEITVVDKTASAVIARKTFEAKPSEHASVRTNTKVVTVPPPLTEMQDYLKSLERK